MSNQNTKTYGSGLALPLSKAELPGELLFPFSQISLDHIPGGIVQAQRVG